MFTYIWRSEYCFCSPRATFTEVYDKARDWKLIGVVKVIFSEVVKGYLEGLHTFLTENSTPSA
jgi:hypothetical protein